MVGATFIKQGVEIANNNASFKIPGGEAQPPVLESLCSGKLS